MKKTKAKHLIRDLLFYQKLTIDEIQEKLNIKRSRLKDLLRELQSEGLIDCTKKGKYWNCSDFF